MHQSAKRIHSFLRESEATAINLHSRVLGSRNFTILSAENVTFTHKKHLQILKIAQKNLLPKK